MSKLKRGIDNQLSIFDLLRQAEAYRRALDAIRGGRFKDEIVPVAVPKRKGETAFFDTDECPRETSYEELSKMKAAFKAGGLTTAGNSSVISDGAAAVVLMSRDKAKEVGCRVRATIGAQASMGIDMKYVLVAPIWAIPKCLKKEGISVEDVALFEINEAFSGAYVAVLRELKIDRAKANVNGGGIAHNGPSMGNNVIRGNRVELDYGWGGGVLLFGAGLITLTASAVSGASYSWTGPGGFTSALQNPTIASATTASCHAMPTLLNTRGPVPSTRAPRTNSPKSASMSSRVKRPSLMASTMSPASRKAVARSSTTT